MNNEIDNQELRKLYESGLSLRDLRRLTGKGQQHIETRIRSAGGTLRRSGGRKEGKGAFKTGVPRPKAKVPNLGWESTNSADDCNQRLKELYESGQSLSALMNLSGLSQRQVKKRLVDTGAKIRPQGHMIGKPLSEEVVRKVSAANIGKKQPPHTEEHKRKLRLARQGRKPSLGMRHSEETRRKMSESRKGAGNGRWIDGRKRTPYPPEWDKRLRQEIRQSQDHRCAICGKQNHREVHVHHIDWDKKNCKRVNLVALCYLCHGLVHRSITAEKYREEMGEYVAKRDAQLETPGA